MKLALEVTEPTRGQRLLSRGFVLDETLIRKLAELHVHELWIEYPDTAMIESYVAPQVVHRHTQLASMVAHLFGAMHGEAHAELDYTVYQRALRDLVEALVAHPMSSAYITELGGGPDNELRHAAEVCFLSVLLGLKLRDYLVQQRPRLQPSEAACVVSMGLGAMMHDVGMALLPEEVRRRYERTRDESDTAWRRHVIVGHHKVSGEIPAAAAGVVRHHHQHYDGSGFPAQVDPRGRLRGLIGEEIHVFARIACVANHFDRLRRPADGRLQPRVKVLRSMLTGSLARRFDPVVLTALTQVVPAYPPGALVTLNNGRFALVMDWHPQAPCQPTVRILQRRVTDDGALVLIPNGEIIDLRRRRELLVAEYEGHDVLADNFRMCEGALRTAARVTRTTRRSRAAIEGRPTPPPPVPSRPR